MPQGANRTGGDLMTKIAVQLGAQLLRRRPVGAQIHEGHHLQILRNPIAPVIQNANIAAIIHHETDCLIAWQRTIGVQGYLDTEFLWRYSWGISQL